MQAIARFGICFILFSPSTTTVVWSAKSDFNESNKNVVPASIPKITRIGLRDHHLLSLEISLIGSPNMKQQPIVIVAKIIA